MKKKKVGAPPATTGLLVYTTDQGLLECMPLCARVGSGRQTQANCVYDEKMSASYIQGEGRFAGCFVLRSKTEMSFSLNFGTHARVTRVRGTRVRTTAVCGCGYLNRILLHRIAF